MNQQELDKITEELKKASTEKDISESSSFKYALRLLARRDYSEYKLKQKLRDRGHSKEEITKTITELLERNYLREDLYREARIRGLMHKGLSPSSIQRRLAEEFCQASLHEIEAIFQDQHVETNDQIERLILKKMPKTWPETREESYKIENKILRFLLSKGHSYQETKSCLEGIKRKREEGSI